MSDASTLRAAYVCELLISAPPLTPQQQDEMRRLLAQAASQARPSNQLSASFSQGAVR